MRAPGGDEFVVLLFNTSAPLAADVIRKFKESLEKHRHETSSKYGISFSYGIVEFDPEKPTAIERMLAEGDSRMYERKHAKK
jgi:diguanylate cyclase (GGDEF)-like protein